MTSHKISCKSNYKLYCFVCEKSIYRGEKITQCVESGGMELRRVPYSGSRWVHETCLPKDIATMKFLDVIDKETKTNPKEHFTEIHDRVENYAYWNQEEDKKYKNLCITCGEDMGPQNPRQLCGKSFCLNKDFISDISSDCSDISNDCSDLEFESFYNYPDVSLTSEEKNRLLYHCKKKKLMSKHLENDIDNLCKELKKMSWWSGKKIEEENKLDILLEMLIEKKKFDEIVDSTLEMLKN